MSTNPTYSSERQRTRATGHEVTDIVPVADDRLLKARARPQCHLGSCSLERAA
jgi:hypothetical protein